MKGVGSIEYAHARLWSRNARRPDEALWHRLEVIREFSGLLDTARTLPEFRDWVAGIAPETTVHEIEAILRRHWRTLVAEVASWMPDAWQPAVNWCAALVDVPVLQFLARGGAAHPWIQRDPAYRDFSHETSGLPPVLGTLTPLAGAWRQPDDLPAAWRAEWSRRAPSEAFADPSLMRELQRTFATHVSRYGTATIRDGWPLRRALQARLLGLFRKAMAEPAAAFIFLALCALDFERLRGELLRRAAFARLPLAS